MRRELQKEIELFIKNGDISSDGLAFHKLAIDVFRYQVVNCDPYSEFCALLDIEPNEITKLEEIPFLPVRFFKNKNVYSAKTPPEIVFTSSATTGMIPSRHPVSDLSLYELSFLEAFRNFYGKPEDFNILALLPSYLEREGSSLVYMTERLIKESKSEYSGFYLYNFKNLEDNLIKLRNSSRKTILLGVSFALVEFASSFKINFPELIIMETGGMKGRGKEMSREEIHNIIKNSFGVSKVHSEYGMAELLSQAYSLGDGVFSTPPWMKFLLRDFTNPLKILIDSEIGGLNIIDLSNVNSCSFIETEDIGVKKAGNLWKIPGRISNSELRGCNLLLG
ncbi:MAG: acyltransferase [Bacteroidales bacterium]